VNTQSPLEKRTKLQNLVRSTVLTYLQCAQASVFFVRIITSTYDVSLFNFIRRFLQVAPLKRSPRKTINQPISQSFKKPKMRTT